MSQINVMSKDGITLIVQQGPRYHEYLELMKRGEQLHAELEKLSSPEDTQMREKIEMEISVLEIRLDEMEGDPAFEERYTIVVDRDRAEALGIKGDEGDE